jgi:Zn-finger protein
VKDCTNCTFPHERKNYDRVIDTLKREARNR